MTCGLNTLWQRFGRAARGPGTEAIAVLFAESKYFDDEKEKAAKAAEARAAKAATKAAGSEKAKRSREASDVGETAASKRQRGDQSTAESIGQTASSLPPTAAESLRASDADSLTIYEQLRLKYRAQVMPSSIVPVPPVVTTSSEPRPEMDAFINAATRTGCCFRLPIMAYYENDRRSKCSPNRCLHRKCPFLQSLHNRIRQPSLLPTKPTGLLSMQRLHHHCML